MPKTHYPYAPGLDGLRGILMAAFMAYHFGATALEGMWIGINCFFVLSGFLLTRLLVEEREQWGSISAWEFYKKRGRRLLPGLFAFLSVITAYCVFFAPEQQRHRFGGDILTTLGFVTNWNLIAQEDLYFGDRLLASPLRHAWTLSIEEQFYVLLPAVVLGLYLLRRRSHRVVFLIGAAIAATAWTAHVAGSVTDNFGRLYYGTDTRVSSLLIGAALGVALGWRRRQGVPAVASRPSLQIAGWASAAVLIWMFLTVEAYSPWMWEKGGVVVSSVAAAVLVAALSGAQRTPLTRVFDWPIAAQFGKLSYGLYLWHWPVILWLGANGGIGSPLVTGLLAFAITTGMAYVSYRFIEEPVLRHGVRGLLPRLRRPVVAVVVPAVCLTLISSTVLLPTPTNAQVTASSSASLPPKLVSDQPGYQAGEPDSFAVLGDSLPWYLMERFPTRQFPGIQPVNLAREGCDLIDRPMVSVYGTKDQHAVCLGDWPQRLKESQTSTLLVFGSPVLAAPHVMTDGQTKSIGDPEFDQLLTSSLTRIATRARRAGVEQINLVNVPCREFGQDRFSDLYQRIQKRTPGYIEEFEQPTKINRVLESWVKDTPDAKLIDLHSASCEEGNYVPTKNDIPLFNDTLHYSPEATPMMVRWLLGQVSTNWQSR
ncbi:acyltransferase family protein [Demetria terragena]|uniref:acyltransferase family protein n=1 Tax=Demetria terragena TaxID=63959 RepID=UPI000362A315|nr:acyltransferase [Demetria terragena]